MESKFGGRITHTSICLPSVVFTQRFTDLAGVILSKTSLLMKLNCFTDLSFSCTA